MYWFVIAIVVAVVSQPCNGAACKKAAFARTFTRTASGTSCEQVRVHPATAMLLGRSDVVFAERSVTARSARCLVARPLDGARSTAIRRDLSLAATKGPVVDWPLNLPGTDAITRTIDKPQVELFNAACVVISLLLFGLQTLTLDTEPVLETIERSIALGFGFEYLVRWYSRNLDPRHVIQPLVVIDLLSFAPTLLHIVLPALAGWLLSLGLSNDPTLVVFYGKAYNFFNFEGSGLDSWLGADFVFLRFVRLVRLQRFLRDGESFANLQLELGIEPNKIKPWQLQLARSVSSILSLLFISSGCLYEAEPQISNYFEALYYAVCTLTTVGGITPETAEGRIVVTVSILAGIAIIPLQLSELSKAYFQFEQELLPESDVPQLGGDGEQSSGLEVDALPGSVRFGSVTQEVELTDVACGACGAVGHRRDAVFCYRCASRVVPSESETIVDEGEWG